MKTMTRSILPRLMALLFFTFLFHFLPAQLSQGGGGGPTVAAGEEKEAAPNCSLYLSTYAPQQLVGKNKHTECSTNGLFCLTYVDVMQGTGAGFDDPFNGASHRQCVMNAVNYLEQILVVPAGTSVEILMLSQVQNPNLPNTALAGAGLYLPDGAGPGYHGGLMQDHLLSGIDPDPTRADGEITFQLASANWSDDCSSPLAECVHDLESVMLHEVTHLMGFASFVDEVLDPNTNMLTFGSRYGNGQFSTYDEHFLHHHGSTVQKVVVGSPPMVNPIVNNANFFEGNRMFMTSDPLPHNDVAFSRPPFRPGTSLSHFNLYWSSANHFAPQFVPPYVMGPFLRRGYERREYTRQDMEILTGLGYVFTAAYPVTTTLGNHPPHLNGDLASGNAAGENSYYNLTPPSNLPGLYFTTDNCNSVLIDLNNMPGGSPVFGDLDGDPITIFPGSIHNIRGCGTGNTLTQVVEISPTQLRFTPRADFWGRAQVGFHLFDGIERGAFVVVTIDVERNLSCFTLTPNLVMNGDCEQGTAKNTISNPNNGEIAEYRAYFDTKVVMDGQSLFSNGWDDSFVRESDICTNPYARYSFDPGPAALPINNTGDRYFAAARIENLYLQLNLPMQNCNQYTLSFDTYFGNPNYPAEPMGTVKTFEFAFAEEQFAQQHFTEEDIVMTSPVEGWFHVTHTFTYTGPDCEYLFLDFPNDGGATHYCGYDNFSLVQLPDPNLPVVTASATGCGKINLDAQVTGGSPPYTYEWSPAAPLFDPLAANTLGQIDEFTTFMVTVTDANGCQSSALVDAFPEVVVDLGPDQEVCFDPDFQLDAGNSGSSYLWSTGETTQTITVLQPGTYSVTVTAASGCVGTDDMVLVEDAEPQGTLQQLTNVGKPVCPGEPTEFLANFSADVIDFYWLDGNGNQVWNTNQVTFSYPISGWYDIELHLFDGCSEKVLILPFEVQPCCGNGPSSLVVGDITASQFIATHNGGSDIVSSNVNYIFDGLLTIDTDLTFLNCPDVHFTEIGRVEISPGHALRVENSHLSGCENGMWKGIQIMDATAYLQFNQSTLVDATEGVVSTAGGDFAISNSTFDLNYIHLSVEPFVGTHSGSLWNTQLVCTGPLKDPQIGDYTRIGIKVNGASDLTLGSPYATGYQCTISDAYNGITATDAHTTVVNFDILNIRSGNTPEAGIGILSQQLSSPAFPTGIFVGGPGVHEPVTLSNMENGVKVEGGSATYVNFCLIEQISRSAIVIKNQANGLVKLKKNQLKADRFGVEFQDNLGTTAEIESNVIDMQIAASTGIAVNALNFAPGPVSIVGNTLTIRKRGIAVRGADDVTIAGNVMTVPGSVWDTRGVRLVNADQVQLSDNQYVGVQGQPVSIGYEAFNCQQLEVLCNRATAATTGFFIDGNLPQTDFRGNRMLNGKTGLYVRNGGIGTQGSFAETSGNIWTNHSQYDIVHENVPVSSTAYWVEQQLVTLGVPANQPPQLFTAALSPAYVCNSTGKQETSGAVVTFDNLVKEGWEARWQLAPNPTTGAVTVTWIGMEVKSVRVVDLQGRVLVHKPCEEAGMSCELSLGQYAAGVYFVELAGVEGRAYRKKVVKQ